MASKTDHWVVISDDDLQLILDGPKPGEDTTGHLWDWITDVQDIIEDGLETA